MSQYSANSSIFLISTISLSWPFISTHVRLNNFASPYLINTHFERDINHEKNYFVVDQPQRDTWIHNSTQDPDHDGGSSQLNKLPQPQEQARDAGEALNSIRRAERSVLRGLITYMYIYLFTCTIDDYASPLLSETPNNIHAT